MAVLPILTYPDPVLKEKSAPVETINRDVLDFVKDLEATLDHSPGCVGIAAPQVGVLLRIVVIDATRTRKPCPNKGRMVLINPEIKDQEGEVMGREGCLSLPHLTANVKRARKIKFTALTPEETMLSVETSEFEARVVLHEIDHLDGLLFLDRVSSLKTDVFRRKNYGAGRGG